MSKIVITKEDKKNFNKTPNGRSKHRWYISGCIIDIIASVGICLLIIFSEYILTPMIFYFLLYLLLVIVVIGGESIGVYYGCLEQYVLHKKEKKEISYME